MQNHNGSTNQKLLGQPPNKIIYIPNSLNLPDQKPISRTLLDLKSVCNLHETLHFLEHSCIVTTTVNWIWRHKKWKIYEKYADESSICVILWGVVQWITSSIQLRLFSSKCEWGGFYLSIPTTSTTPHTYIVLLLYVVLFEIEFGRKNHICQGTTATIYKNKYYYLGVSNFF